MLPPKHASKTDQSQSSFLFCLKTGATAAGVPGEVKGFYEAWKKYGELAWKDLVQPTINMARNGFPFGYSAYYAAKRTSVQPRLKADPGHRLDG